MLASSFQEYGFHKVPLRERLVISILHGPRDGQRFQLNLVKEDRVDIYPIPSRDPSLKSSLGLDIPCIRLHKRCITLGGLVPPLIHIITSSDDQSSEAVQR